MDPIIKKQWLEALRSGHFKQIKNEYGMGDCRCALGVLQAVCNERHQAESFLFDTGPFSKGYSTWQFITDANDKHGWSFEQIADWIEVFVD